jgi:hypothetical protein
MGRRGAVAGLICIAALLAARPGSAQAIGGGGLQRDVQRFSGDPGLNRLDGAARGWMVFGGITLRSHLAVRVEGSRGDTIDNEQVFTLDVDGRSTTIRSSLDHRSRSLATLGGYAQPISSRVSLIFLAGASFTHVERTFTTNAPDQILVPVPGQTVVTQAAPVNATKLDDDFTAFISGVEAVVSITRHLGIVAGVRAQPLDLDVDLSGWSVRPFAGGAWIF